MLKGGLELKGGSVTEIKKALDAFSDSSLSLLPTPVQELPALSDILGCKVYCKRDDLTGFGFGGNKSRKLDFLLPYAQGLGADTLIAVGANQSNFCRMTAAFGSVWNMEVHLVLGGGKPTRPTGNLLVDHILGAHVHHVESMDWDEWNEAAQEIQGSLEARGRNVFRMPVGGSTCVGALGYVKALLELMEDEKRFGIRFSRIIHASSSAGTQAGLTAAKILAGWPGEIIGMSVAKPKDTLTAEVRKLAADTMAFMGLGRGVEEDVVSVDDSYIGDCYAARTSECDEAVKLFARKCGLFLDRVYTGKAAAGLLDYGARKRFSSDENICFLHTGGNLEIFE